MTKVCHLTTVHQPFDVRIFQKECRSLARAGYDVSLVAVHEKDETVDGVRILALKKPSGRIERWRTTRSECLKRALETGAQLFHFHDPELIPVGLELKRLGRTVFYDVHESHAESILDREYLPAIVRKPMSRLLARSEREADLRLDGIVAATPKIARSFTNPRTVLIQNYPQVGELAPASAVPLTQRESAFVYVGGVSAVRGAREMVAALGLVTEARLIVVGEFSPSALKSELQSLASWSQVEVLGWQDRAGVARAMGRAIGGIVLFHPLKNHVESQPNKLFEYMSAGLPVIASDFPHWREIVDSVDCGLLANPMDVEQIADAMKKVLSDRASAEAMGRRGQDAVRTKLNWGAQEAVLLDLYRSAVSP